LRRKRRSAILMRRVAMGQKATSLVTRSTLN
jgi:hypothetical protein